MPSPTSSAGAPFQPRAFSPQPFQPLTLDARRARRREAEEKRKRRGASPQSKPTGLERRFATAVDALISPLLSEAERELRALRNAELTDAEAERVLRDLERRLDLLLPTGKLKELAAELVEQVQAWNARQLRRQLALDEVGIRVPELTGKSAERLARHAVATIRGIPAEIATKAGPLVRDASIRGLRAEAFAGELGKRLGVSEGRAREIATGTVLRTNARINEERHERLGIVEYTWRASRDSHTRRWHRALDGQRFRYDDPPIGGGGGPKDRGNPGSADRCRCQAIPVIPR